jgi:hypothetical protein
VARSSKDALTLLDELGNTRIHDLWLDHDLEGDDTIRPVVDLLVQLAKAGSPLNVGRIHIHSANIGGGHWMDVQLGEAGYRVTHNYALTMWTHDGR